MAECKSTNEVLKDIRAKGATPKQMKASQVVLKAINDVISTGNIESNVDPKFTIDLKNKYRDEEIAVVINGRSLTGYVNWLIGYKNNTTKVSVTLKNSKEYIVEVGTNGKSKNGNLYIPALENAREVVGYNSETSRYAKETTAKGLFSKADRLNYANPLIEVLKNEFEVNFTNEDISSDLVVENLIKYGYKVLDGNRTHMFNEKMIEAMMVEAKYVAETNTIVYPGKLDTTEERLQTVVKGMFEAFEKESGKAKADEVKNKISVEVEKVISTAVAKRRKLLRDSKEELKPEVLLHELGHALTENYLIRNSESEVVNELDSIRLAVTDVLMQNKYLANEDTYWQTNLEEFLSEALSNPALIIELSKIPVKDIKDVDTVLQAIVKFVAGMFGKKYEDSVFDAIMYRLSQIADEQGKTKSRDELLKRSKLIKESINKDSSSDEVLGSSEDILNKTKKNTFDKFKKLEEDIHGNPDKMLDLIDMLENAEGNLTDRAHLEYLKDVIKSLNPKYLTKMNTYVMENAKETGGVVTTDSIGIMIGKKTNPSGNRQTAAEVYVHEVVHAYTRFAIEMARSGDQTARKIYRELQHAIVVAKKDTKWQDFLGKKEDSATENEKDVAKEMYKYIFDSEHSEEEFTAHALTNPLVMAKLKRVPLRDSSNKTVCESIKSNFSALVGWILGEVSFKNKNKDVYRATVELVMRLGELNNRKINKLKQQENIVDRLADMIDNADDKASELLFKFLEKISPDNELLGQKPDNALGKSKWYAKALGKMIFNGDYRKHLLTYLDRVGLLDMRGTLSSIINDLIAQDEVQKAVDWLGLRSDKHDQNRMNIISTTKGLVCDAFSRKLTKEEEEDVTEVLVDTDVQSISDKYGVKGIRRMLEDSDVLEKNIAKARNRLKELDEKNANWHLNQASGLGYYLATGKAHIAQNMNAKNIARGMLGLNRKRGYSKVKGDLEQAIDEVATLTALRYTNNATKGRVAKLLLEESDGIKTVLKYGQYLKEEARKTIFKGQEAFMVKGYTKELFADNLELEAVPMSKAAEMEAKGYTFVKELENHSLVTTKEKYGLFKTEMFGLQEWNRTATRLTKMHRKGTSLEEIYYEESSELGKKKHLINVKKINIERMKLAKQMEDGEVNLEELEYGLSPMIDQYGEVSSYRYMMPKKEKRDLLEQDLRVSEVFAATRGSMVDKLESIEHNKKVLELIKEDAATNYVSGQTIGKDGSVYVLITENSSDEKIQELWKILPKDFKQEAYRNQEGGLPVRKDLINNLFGYRHLTFANFPGLEKIMPQMLKNAIQIAEAIWMEFIKITKVDILVKMPFVLVGNILSNMIFALTTRLNPLELVGMYRESLRDVKSYLKTHKEWIKLKELEGLGKLSVAEKKTINMLEKQLKESPIHELYEKGLYQAIVEDASMEELSATNKLKKWYNEKTYNVPKIIKDGVNWAYLTEETQYYKFMTEVLQISDLLARDVERKKLDIVNKRQANGESKLPMWYIQHLKDTDDKYGSIIKHRANIDDRKRILDSKEKEYFKKLAEEYKWNYLLNAFINYNKSSGPAEEYLNRMGFIMFTKYAKRIQRVISETGTKYPLKSLLILLGDNLIYDADTIQDQSVFTRSWYNVTPQYPWDRILDVMTPPIVQESTYRII